MALKTTYLRMTSALELKYFTIFIFLILNQILGTSQTHFGITSYCVENSFNDIQFGTTGDSSYGTFAMSSSQNSTYKMGINCTVQLKAPQHYKLHLSFSEISTRSCFLDKITVSKSDNLGANGTVLCGHRSCPAENCPDLQFDSSIITVQFTTSSNKSEYIDSLKGFIGMVTVFSMADTRGNCYSKSQYRCRNRHCIWKGLFCNKHNHCGDESDEPLGCKPFAQQNLWGVLVIIFGIASFCIFLPVFVFMAVRGQRRRVKVYRSTYQPIPTSINAEDRQIYNAAIIRDEDTPSFKFYDEAGTSESTPVHSKTVDNKYISYQNV